VVKPSETVHCGVRLGNFGDNIDHIGLHFARVRGSSGPVCDSNCSSVLVFVGGVLHIAPASPRLVLFLISVWPKFDINHTGCFVRLIATWRWKATHYQSTTTILIHGCWAFRPVGECLLRLREGREGTALVDEARLQLAASLGWSFNHSSWKKGLDLA
jgi:hypothetical protein